MTDFLERIKDIENPIIKKKIESADPYIICDLLEETKGGPNGIYLRELEEAIIKTNDITQIYEFLFLAVDMNIIGFNRERFEQEIRQSGNPKLMCYCIGFVPGTDIKKMIEALIDTKNTKYMEMILKNEEYEEALGEIISIYPNYEEEVEESKQFDFYPESLQEFIELKGNINALKEKIIETKNPYLITELANYIEYLSEYKNEKYDISDLTKAQEELKDPMQSYEYLASVNLDKKEGLINSIINAGRIKFMYYVLEYVPNLTEDEKKILKARILEIEPNGKYAIYINESKQGEEKI